MPRIEAGISNVSSLAANARYCCGLAAFQYRKRLYFLPFYITYANCDREEKIVTLRMLFATP
jgi:hypothetical protein